MSTAAMARVARGLPGGARPPGASPVTLTLPLPPSSNNLFLNSAIGRSKSGKYRRWRAAAAWEVQVQRPHRIAGPYALEIAIDAATRGDIDNRLKAISDILVMMNVVDDDAHCARLSIARTPGIEGVCLTITSAAGTGAPA